MKHHLFLRGIKLFNAILMTAVFAVGWFFYYENHMYDGAFQRVGNQLVLFLFLVVYSMFGRIYDAFLVSLHKVPEMVYSQGLAALLSDGIMYIIICLLTRDVSNVIPLALVFTLQIAVSIIWCILASKAYFKTYSPKRTVVIYDRREGMENLISEYGLSAKFDVKAVCTTEQCISGGLRVIRRNRAEVVYLSGVHSHERNIILKYCVRKGIIVYVIPRIGDTIMSGARKVHIMHLPVFRVDRYDPNPEYLFVKRLFDISFSIAALTIFSPILIITAICILIEDGRPVLYLQERLTKDGKIFKVIKFRSMRNDAEKDGIPVLSAGDEDSRITRVGRVIRRLRIDELPQFINILKGEMSIVGPRPERPEISKMYEAELSEFNLRLQAKAGLTGLAQVYGKYNTSPYDKLMMDLMYIAHPSVFEDLRLILVTLKILFMRESTEGFHSDHMLSSVHAGKQAVNKETKGEEPSESTGSSESEDKEPVSGLNPL